MKILDCWQRHKARSLKEEAFVIEAALATGLPTGRHKKSLEERLFDIEQQFIDLTGEELWR